MTTARYDFTVDWTTHHHDLWLAQLAHIVGKPGIRLLEIGSFEGRSAAWFLDHVLTHPSSTITCVDTFEGSPEHNGMGQVASLEERCRRNLARHGDRAMVLRGTSFETLHSMEQVPQFDASYIDGSHDPLDVLTDAVLTWRLLKQHGIIIFDDYLWDPPPSILKPKAGIDGFLTALNGRYDLLHSSYQVIISKR